MSRAVVVGLAAASLAVRAGSAGAADDTEYETLLRHGLDLRRQNNDAAALIEFERAFRLKPTLRARGQIGFAKMALGQSAAAEEDLKAVLAQPDDPWVAKNRAVIDKALDALDARLGTLIVRGSPCAARITVDGRTTAAVPLGGATGEGTCEREMRVAAGSVTVTMDRTGFRSATRKLEIVGGQVTRESIELAPADGPAAVGATPSPLPATPAAMKVSPETGRASVGLVERPGGNAGREPANGRSLWSHWYFWAVVGVVLAGAGVGALELGKNRDQIAPCPPAATCGSH